MFGLRTAWFAAGLVAATVTLAPLPVFAFGALAVDGQGAHQGASEDQGSLDGARHAALAKCGAQCEVVVTFHNTCAAFATDKSSNLFGWGYDVSPGRAEALALSTCRATGGTACTVRALACDARRNARGLARLEHAPPSGVGQASRGAGMVADSGGGRPDPAQAARRAVEAAFSKLGRGGGSEEPQAAPPPPPPSPALAIPQITLPPREQPAPPAVVAAPAPQQPRPQVASAPASFGNVPQVAPQQVAPPSSPSAADVVHKVALVIGNDRYENLPTLQKAVNDARAVANALSRLGFDVIRVENGARRLINQKMLEFSNRIGRGDTAFFYYAGHGIEVRGTNYLLPTDTPQAREGEESLITGEGIPADTVIERMQERGAKITLMVLDACRENPFKQPGTRGAGGGTRGLGQMVAPEGVFVLYSAGLNQTALDRLSDGDANPNSVFTRTFVNLLGQPGITVQELAKTTQLEVNRLAKTVNHPQMPAYYDQILGSYTLAPR